MKILIRHVLFCVAFAAPLSGCNMLFKKTSTEQPVPVVIDSPQEDSRPQRIQIATKAENVQQEGEDRLHRVERLAHERNLVHRPEVKLVQVERPNESGLPTDYPVLRIRFSDMAFFDFNSDNFRPDSSPAIDLVADALKRDLPDTQVLLLGHTDSIGTTAYNMDLSKRRAIAVMKALNKRGIPFSQMTTVAIGEMQPLKTNTTPEGRSINRRVEFFISADHEANMQVVRDSDFCEDCINDQEADKQDVNAVAEASAPSVDDLGIIRITDDNQVVQIGGMDLDHGDIIITETLETSARRAIGSPLLHARKKVRDY